jgi:hypothetical protein
VALLHPEEQVFKAMLDGWRNQQLARNLALSTIGKRRRACGRSSPTPMRSRGRRNRPMSGSVTCGRCVVARTRRCGLIRTRCAPFVST